MYDKNTGVGTLSFLSYLHGFQSTGTINWSAVISHIPVRTTIASQ